MKYEIVFDTSTDKYANKRLVMPVTAAFLSSAIANLQRRGRIIYSVRQINY